MIIKSVSLNAGRSTGAPSQRIEIGAVTVFVGPNNSGKSRALAEIQQYTANPLAWRTSGILKSMDFEGLNDAELAEAELDKMRISPPNASPSLFPSLEYVQSRRGVLQVDREAFIKAVRTPSSNIDLFSVWLSTHVLMLGGATRISLINQQPSGDLQSSPQTSFQRLFQDEVKRSEFREIVHNALGFYPVIDPTFPGFLRLKVSGRAPVAEMEERGWHSEAVSFHKSAESIDGASDGVKAFTGIVLELIAGDPRILLIDEPEAFLHPALAFKLGNQIGSLASREKKNVFVSTHSSSFLMGCLQSGTTLNIVRLTYANKVATARVLPNSSIIELMRNPLLRSIGVVSALFYEFVIVTEGDADRAFYSEINERLIRFDSGSGIPNCLFLNSQGKHTLHTIVKPLRDLGIPTAFIVDIDFLKDGGLAWTRLLDAANIPKISRLPWGTIRSSINEAFQASGKDMKRDGGLSLLTEEERQAATDLFENMSAYGIFPVSGGEVESWLKHLDVSGHGPTWLIEMFEKMGADPTSTSYIKPTDEDVWRFIRSIKGWLMDPYRKGIPS